MMVDTNKRSARTLCARRLLPVCLLTGLAVGSLPVRTAHAQEDSSADIAAARSLAVEGLKLADAGRCADAIDKLTRAEKLHHAPIVLARLGECQVQQGKIVEGTENLRRVLREPVPANPSAALTRARDQAESTLEAAKPKIAALTISVSGQQGKAISVTVDGRPVQAALLDAERPTDPGEHVVEASATGFLKTSSRVSLGPGEKQAVSLKLEPDPNYVAPSAAPKEEAPAASPRGPSNPEPSMAVGASSSLQSSPPNRVPAYVVWGIGGASLVAGGVFGILAMKGKSDLDGACPGNVCPPSQQDKLDAANTKATISTVLFAVGGGGVALGTILFFTASGGRSSEVGSPARHAGTQAQFQAQPWVGLGRVGVSGSF
jgi:hypothetical protein